MDDNNAAAPVMQSSYLAHPLTIAIWLAVCIGSALNSHPMLAVFSGFVFSLTLCSLVWGRLSLWGLRYELTLPGGGVFPRQRITLTRTVHNGKMLPLLWFELLEP